MAKTIGFGPIEANPEQFYSQLQQFACGGTFATEKREIRLRGISRPLPGDGVVRLTMVGSYAAPHAQPAKTERDVIVFTLAAYGTDRMRGEAHCIYDQPPSLVAYFDSLLAEIGRRWLGASEHEKALHIGKDGKPGRPRYDDDDWAFEEITHGGREPREVFRIWQERPGVLARESNDWPTFTAAMRRRRRKATKR
jgi:hypothetical protein